ncbi:hypothetical protein U9990_16000, partial [Lactiplantibacillus plantarum]|uniref:hypothetical protein n=1 Tax=Lactiplantibacillus plantarum TaxID=1590 RepID=UPI003F1273D2
DRRLASALLVAAGVGMALVVNRKIARDSGPAVGNAITYALDTEQERAHWLSADARLDAWKLQFLGERPARGRV